MVPGGQVAPEGLLVVVPEPGVVGGKPVKLISVHSFKSVE